MTQEETPSAQNTPEVPEVENQTTPVMVRVDNHSARYWEILQFNVEWLRFSETKAGVILTLYGVIFTIVYTNSTAVLSSLQASNWIVTSVFLYGALSITSIVFAFLCINPDLKNENLNSMIYFRHISKQHSEFKAYKTYAQSILDNEDHFTDQITEQIFQNSRLALKKFNHVTWSLRFFFGSLTVMLLTIICYVITSLYQ